MPDRPAFLFAEDKALLERVSNLAVVDSANPERRVKSYYVYPDTELEKAYPFVTVDLIDISPAHEREASEQTYYYVESPSESMIRSSTDLQYYPDSLTKEQLSAIPGMSATEKFVPVDLMYQVTTWCRNPIHDRQLTGLILRRVFPFRRGFIEVPEDGTIRRLDLLDWRKADILDQETGYRKAIHRKVYTVSINAEIPQADLFTARQVLEVRGTLVEASPLVTPPFSEEF